MANAINTKSKLWILNTNDIISAKPICISKVQMIATAAADLGTFYTVSGSATADHDNYFTNLTFKDNITVLDAATGNVWTGITANDWVHITECSEPLNNGWWYLKTDVGNNEFDVENTTVSDGSTKNITAGTAEKARIRTYTPEICMKIIADTDGGSGTPIHHPVLDWGERGRWFDNLAYLENSGDSHEIYLYIK